MQITFYVQSSPINKVNKTMTTLSTTGATPQPNGPIDVVNPVFIVDGPISSTANYFYVAAPLNRYYFITAMDYTIANKVIVSGHIDVLTTYKSLLKTTTLNYIRGAGDINEMDDASYPISDYMIEQYFPMSNWTDIFKNTGSGRQYLLRTIRGQAAVYPTVTGQNGMVVWCGTYTEDNETVYYDCYQINQVASKTLSTLYNKRSNIIGITQLYPGYYLRIGTGQWQLKDLPDRASASLKFRYVGETT